MDIEEVKKEFDKNKQYYEEVLEIITNKISKKVKNQIHSIKFRIKDFESFYNKICRKNYLDPFKECTDIAGIRVITLYKSQAERIAEIIKKEFKLIEEVKKEIKENEFAYKSIHLIVSLKQNQITNKELKQIPCEIQIRTILEEAWAEIEHHMNYKHIGVDKKTLRKINALSALLEIADNQFEQIYDSFKRQLNKPTRITKIEPESIYYYCKKKFPWAWKNSFLKEEFEVENISNYNKIEKLCKNKRINSIKELDEVFENKKEFILKENDKRVKEILNNPQQWPKLHKRVKESKFFYSPTTIISLILKEI